MAERVVGVVGFVGLGNMGIPMSRRLAGAGYHVRGFDTSAEARRNFADISAIPSLRASARTSCEMRIEQNFGPHIEQKCASLCPSFGSVAS